MRRPCARNYNGNWPAPTSPSRLRRRPTAQAPEVTAMHRPRGPRAEPRTARCSASPQGGASAVRFPARHRCPMSAARAEGGAGAVELIVALPVLLLLGLGVAQL